MMIREYREGHVLNRRTLRMLRAAEERLGFSLHVMQGSYNRGGISASAGTHDGGGALDVSAQGRSREIVHALREVGFAAWHRVPSQGNWSEHIHAIAIADPELSRGARTQVSLYYRGLNGLSNGGRDDGPRLDPIPVWPVSRPKIDLSNVQAQFKSANPRRLTGVARIQRMLNKKRNENLVTDGKAGAKTRAAYKRWEKHLDPSHVTGVPGPKNLAILVNGYYRVV